MQLVERLKQHGEQAMIEKREKTMLELSKLKRRVDEFSYYGELEMMVQYVSDVRNLQKRVNEVQESIAWINVEEQLYKYPQTQFPELDEINTGLDPFARLFQAVVKWQKAEKKYVRLEWFLLKLQFSAFVLITSSH
jgi:hypothetical protein